MLDTLKSWAQGEGEKGQLWVPVCLAGDFFFSYFQIKNLLFSPL